MTLEFVNKKAVQFLAFLRLMLQARIHTLLHKMRTM